MFTERDFKSQYLFHMCSVAATQVTFLEVNLIRCSTALCHFGRTRNIYVATHFSLLRSTAESSATGSHVVVPERFGQKEEPSCRNEERITKNRVLFPAMDTTDAICKHM